MSESLPVEAWSREAIFRLIYECERVIYPVAIKSGAYYYPQGAYQVFEAPDGARIGIWAQDPDDLVLEERVVDEKLAGQLFKYDEFNNRVPVAVGDKLPGRIKDLGNGNIERLRIFTVKQAYESEKWLHEEMNKHQAAYRSFVLEQGMIVRESPSRWTSGGIVYHWLDDNEQRGVISNFVHMNGIEPRIGDGGYSDDDGTPCSDLIMTTAPTYGWRLGHDYQKLYRRDIVGSFLRAASLRAKRVTRAQAQDLVIKDFEKRAPRFIEGQDPYRLREIGARQQMDNIGRMAKLVHKHPVLRAAVVQWRARPIRKAALYFLYGLRQLQWKEVANSAAIVGISAVILSGIAHWLGSPLNPAVLAGRISGRTLNKASQRINEYTRGREMLLNQPGVMSLYQYYAKNWNRRQIWGTKPDTKKLHLLRALSHKELNTDLNFCSAIEDELPPDLPVKEYIFGVLQGPPGSRITPFRFGRYGGIRVDEPNGLSIEHVPERDACFARLDWSKLDHHRLPDSVVRLFESLPSDQPYLKISYNPEKGGLQMCGVTVAEYTDNIESIRRAEFPPPHRRPSQNEIRLVAPEIPDVKVSWFGAVRKDATGQTAGDATEDGVEKLADFVKILRP